MSDLGKGLAVIAGIILVSLFQGVVLSILWAWFVEPLGVPHIGIAGALGLSTTFQLVAASSVNDEEDVDWRRSFMLAFVRVFAALVFGFAYHLFMA